MQTNDSSTYAAAVTKTRPLSSLSLFSNDYNNLFYQNRLVNSHVINISGESTFILQTNFVKITNILQLIYIPIRARKPVAARNLLFLEK